MAQKNASRPAGVKKVPMRMCVGCHEMFPKREMLRVVRLAAPEEAPAQIVIDKTGKLSGRGAYICAKPECFEKARKTKALERALSGKIEDGVFDVLKEQLV